MRFPVEDENVANTVSSGYGAIGSPVNVVFA
jgi:hypothetical protein